MAAFILTVYLPPGWYEATGIPNESNSIVVPSPAVVLWQLHPVEPLAPVQSPFPLAAQPVELPVRTLSNNAPKMKSTIVCFMPENLVNPIYKNITKYQYNRLILSAKRTNFFSRKQTYLRLIVIINLVVLFDIRMLLLDRAMVVYCYVYFITDQ